MEAKVEIETAPGSRELENGTFDAMRQEIEDLYDRRDHQRTPGRLALLASFRKSLENGEIRAAEPRDGVWSSNPWVKKGILLNMALGMLVECGTQWGAQQPA